MVDLAEKIKKKLTDEIALLEHELHTDLPKEISVARAHGDLKEKTPSTNTLRNASRSSPRASANSTNAWPISPC
jgi:hypothetical protein